MIDELKQLLEKTKTGKGKIIFILGLAGILLIYFSSLSGGKNEKGAVDNGDVTYEYCQQLEERVELLVKNICGSKKVSVVITLDSGKQYVYADEGRTQTTENTNDCEQNYTIIKSESGAENGLLVTEYMPTVRGVAVVCDLQSVDAEEKIRDAISAALDISNSKIYVTQYVY